MIVALEADLAGAGVPWTVLNELLRIDIAGDAAAARKALNLLTQRPEIVARLDGWSSRDAGGDGPIALALATLSASGYVRQPAVERMTERMLPEFAPFLVLRTADWVAEVRQPARAGLATILYDAPTTYLPAALGMALHLQARQRGGFARAQVLAAALAAPSTPPPSSFPNRAVRAFLLDAGIAAGRLRLRDLVALSESDPDARLRGRASEAAAREAVWSGQEQVARRLAASRHPEVRVVGVTALVRSGCPGEAVNHLEDPSGLVRAVARAAARRVGVDAHARYRVAIEAGIPSRGAVDGFTEIATSADVQLLQQLLGHDDPRVRARALRALRTLGSVPFERAVAMLCDPSPGVIREATAALRPFAARITADLPWKLLRDPERAAARRAGYTLLQGSGGTSRLRAALLAAADPDRRLAARATADVTRTARLLRDPWRRRGERRLTATRAEAAELLSLLPTAEPALGRDTADVLRMHLRALAGP